METIRVYAVFRCLNPNCLNESSIVEGDIQIDIENGAYIPVPGDEGTAGELKQHHVDSRVGPNGVLIDGACNEFEIDVLERHGIIFVHEQAMSSITWVE